MHHGFWQLLPRPFTALAPMSGITDAAFRAILARYGKPDVTFTEFVPADGLCSPGCANLLPRLRYSAAERPVVAQLHGGDPESFRQSARIVAELGFDGVDINLGCPSRLVERHGGGAVLIRRPQLAREIIAAAQDGAGSLPVSVKTRLGLNRSDVEGWIAGLLAAAPAALTVHARTRSQGFAGQAQWDAVAQCAALAQAIYPDAARRPLIIGNGDVRSLAQARQRAADSHCDGVMIGRGALGNPWCFTDGLSSSQRPLEEVLAVMREHTRLYIDLHSGPSRCRLEPMCKHYKAYLRRHPAAAPRADRDW